MSLFVQLFLLAAVCSAGYLLTFKAVPWVFVRIGRRLGFKMKATPLTERRLRRFRRIKRGYWAFVLITTAFVTSLFLELVVNHKPLYISYGEQTQYPAVASWLNFAVPGVDLIDSARWNDYGLPEAGEGELDGRQYSTWVDDPALLEAKAVELEAEIVADEKRFRTVLADNAAQRGMAYDPSEPLPDWKQDEQQKQRDQAAAYRRLKGELEQGMARVMMPIYPFSNDEILLQYKGNPPYPTVWEARSNVRPWPLLGTDFDGRDVLAQLVYGFRVSFAFAIFVAFIGYIVGVMVGGIMGFFGGWVDIAIQRGIEVWSSIPFFFTIMILASIVNPTFMVLAFLLIILRAWLAITYTVRGEFYREKSRDYVQAARAIGVKDFAIMFRHILPNSLVPVVSFMPFSIVAHIGALVSLDYLGFGLPPSVPSWGRLLRQGADNIVNYPELVLIPVFAFAATLFCVVMIGEAVREAFDPKEYARLR